MWVRPSIAFYGSFSLDMDRSPGFGSTYTDLNVLLTLAFTSAPELNSLTLPASVTRRTVLQKVRGRACYCSQPTVIAQSTLLTGFTHKSSFHSDLFVSERVFLQTALRCVCILLVCNHLSPSPLSTPRRKRRSSNVSRSGSEQ